eukprot:PITA_01613
MKDIGLMYYFLELEVWQQSGEIFLRQGKYAVDILRFRMEDYRPMSTSMITNLKKLSASKGELVDPALYKQLIGSVMYLMGPTVIHCDNHSCIKFVEIHEFHDRPKHIKIRYHFIKDRVQRGVVKLQYISIEEQMADALTKPLVKGKFVKYQDKL